MGKLVNDITILAPVEKVWEILADLGLLEKTDPAVRQVTVLSPNKTGAGPKQQCWCWTVKLV